MFEKAYSKEACPQAQPNLCYTIGGHRLRRLNRYPSVGTRAMPPLPLSPNSMAALGHRLSMRNHGFHSDLRLLGGFGRRLGQNPDGDATACAL